MGFTPRIERLAIRLPGPARFLAGRIRRTAAPAVAPAAATPGDVALAAAPAGRPSAIGTPRGAPVRIAVPVLRMAPECEGWARVTSVHAAMAAQGRWDEILSALRDADASRLALPGGKRVVELVSEGARGALTAAIARRDMTAAQAEIARLEQVLADHPGDLAAAHLVAQAHLDIGWALRGEGHVAHLSRIRWQSFLEHTARAEAVLEMFDPLESFSPLLAATRYLTVRGLPEGEDLCRDWYEDWCDLDPTNWTVHASHAPLLLPQWYGSIRAFDRAAREAMLRTEDRMGAAAYAMFYMAAADSLGDLPPIMDLPMVLRGLADFRAQTGCQYRANIAGGVLAQMAHVLYLEGPAAQDRLDLVGAALRDLMTTSLREFHLPAWDHSESCIRWALEQAFGNDLAPGTRIQPGADGEGLVLARS